MDWRERIESDGEPRVRGTEVAVSDVLDELSAHLDLRDVLKSHPRLSEDDVRACLAWAAAEVDAAWKKAAATTLTELLVSVPHDSGGTELAAEEDRGHERGRAVPGPGGPAQREAAPGAGVTLIERHGLLIAHGDAGAALPEELFDHRADRDARAKSLWGGS